MEILPVPTSNKHCGRCSDNENKQVMVNLMQSVLEDPILQAGNPVKEFLPKLNLPDHETEVCGIDILHLYEVFSLEVKRSSIRILLALVAQMDLELVQMDVKTAFLHGDLEEEIYMVQPEGFKVAGKEHEVCKLYKLLYGLKQSPRQWYKLFDKFMMDSKYTRSKYDHCVYLKKLHDGSFVYLLLYVNDTLIASQILDQIEKLKTRLKSEFEIKDLC
ncbi:transposable element [Tanacetum coccineum]